MAAPMNSGESDMATEDFLLNLSPLPSPRWSPLRLTPSPPRHFVPSSSSMVMQYQGSNQSMDDPPQNQEHDDIIDLAPYLAGDSPLLQQQLRKNNQGIEELNMGFEEESEEEMTTWFYFPPSPTYFPLYRPMPTVFFVSTSNIQNISSALSCQHLLEDKSGAWHVIDEDEQDDISDLLIAGYASYLKNNSGDMCRALRAAGVVPKDVNSLLDNLWDENNDKMEMTLRRINWLEQHDEDMVDQPVFEQVVVVQQLIQNKGGELDVIFGGRVYMVNGLEHSDSEGSPMTPETLLICQAKLSFRVWLGHSGQLAIEGRWRCIRLNIGSFTIVEDAISAYEVVARWSGWMDLTVFPGLFENENRSKLPPQLPPTAQEEKRGEDFGLVRCNAMGNDEIEAVGTGSEGTGECVMTDQARLNSLCLEKRKRKEKNLGGEKRNQKTNGVRLAIPLENILQTKGMRRKDAAKCLKVSRSTLLNPNTLPSDQTLAATIDTNNTVVKETLPLPFLPTAQQEILDEDFGMGVEAVGMGSERTGDSETEDEFNLVSRSRQLNPDTLPSNQALAANIDTNSAVVKEIVPPLLLPTAQQKNLDEDFGNGVEAVGMGSERTEDEFNTVSRSTNGQLNSRNLEKRKREKMTPSGERRNKKTNGVRIAIPLEDILQTKKMFLKDAANHLKVSQSSLKNACRKYGISRWPPCKLFTQSHPNETPALLDQEVIPQLNFDTLPSDQALAVTVEKITSVIVKEILPPPFSPTARQESLDEDFCNFEAEAIGIGSGGTGQSGMEEGQLNSKYLGKEKRKEMNPRGERRNKETGGVKIAISLEEILQTKEMPLKDAAKHLKVSKSTLKRACREYDIPRWPPRGEHKLISQPCPNESPMVVDKESIPQLNSDTLLPSNQVSATIGTKSVIVKARFGTATMKFQLFWPWEMEKLNEQVKKRLGHEAENYHINYKDEDNEYIMIGCDEDLQDHISRSNPLGTNLIEVFLQPK